MATKKGAKRGRSRRRECLKIAFRQAKCLINSNTTAGKKISLSGLLRLITTHYDGQIGIAFSVGTNLFLRGCDSKHIAPSASVGNTNVLQNPFAV